MSGIGRRRPATAALVNLGCRVNRVELDVMASELAALGIGQAPEGEAAAVVVNTCAVTGEAEAKARKAVRHAASLPGTEVVVATGCVANLFADELAALGPNVVVENLKHRVAGRVAAELAARGIEPDFSADVASGHGGVTPTGRMRPGIKVQDGCDNRCTYCIVWKARGKATSLPLGDVVSQVRDLVAKGAREVVLTGINLGRYQDGAAGLPGLLDALLEATDVGRLRLGSVEPPEVTPELLSVMAKSDGRVAPFLHLPLQSGSDAVLARMGRLYDTGRYRAVAAAAREAVPGLALACDLIVGFPGETDGEFSESLAFCREMGYANMHVFRYSKRPGTPAAEAPGQVGPEVMAERSRAMRAVAKEGRRAYAESRLGVPELVLVESRGKGVTGGLVEALVHDDARPGELRAFVPRAVGPGSILDCR